MVDRLVDILDIGSKIKDNVRENMPDIHEVEQEVSKVIKRRR